MNVLILVASYPPVIESASRLYSQLAESLVAMGHAVTVVTEHPAENLPVERRHPYFQDRRSDGMLRGVRVCRVSPLTFMAKVPGGKAARFLFSCALFAVRTFFLPRQQVILVYSPPLFMGVAGRIASLRHRAPMVVNVQDLHPKVLFDLGAIRNRWIGAMLLRMEAMNYRNAHAFIVYSNGNRDYLRSRQVRGAVWVIPNWVDTAELTSADSGNSFRAEESIGGRFLLSYAGIMKPAQGLEVIIEAAELLRDRIDIVFFLAGEGSSKAELARLIAERKLDNVLLRPVMPAERYIRCLLASDVCLVTLGAGSPPETVPGKLAYIMASERPVLAAVSLQGDAAKVIQEAGAGLCVDPGDGRGLANAVLALHDDTRLREEAARNAGRYAQHHFSRESCTRQYEAALRDAVST